MKKPHHIRIDAFWDEELQLWSGSSRLIPGLVIKADTIDALRKEAYAAISELIVAEALPIGAEGFVVEVRTDFRNLGA